MRKLTILVLALLLAALPAFAEGTVSDPNANLILSGTVVAKQSTSVKAPFGGAVEDFTLRVGDVVQAGDVLFTLSTTKIYADCDGTVGGLMARPGDSATYLTTRYGALCYIEPANSLIISTTTANAYTAANRFIHIGESVYIKSTTNSTRSGTGIVTAVTGTSFTVEVNSGNLQIADSATIYRQASYASSSRIGSGSVTRVDPIAVAGTGSVLKAYVSEGDQVKRGDLLFEMVTGDLAGMTLPEAGSNVVAPCGGIVASISATAGASVSADQVMATIDDINDVQIAATVSEMDVAKVDVGATVRVEFEYMDGTSYTGTISSISAIGVAGTDDTQYTVYVDITPDAFVRQGMSAMVYFN